jgi:hypothetical protein
MSSQQEWDGANMDEWGDGSWEEKGSFDAETQTNVSDVTGVDCAGCAALQEKLAEALRIIDRLKRQLRKAGLQVDETNTRNPTSKFSGWSKLKGTGLVMSGFSSSGGAMGGDSDDIESDIDGIDTGRYAH